MFAHSIGGSYQTMLLHDPMIYVSMYMDLDLDLVQVYLNIGIHHLRNRICIDDCNKIKSNVLARFHYTSIDSIHLTS